MAQLNYRLIVKRGPKVNEPFDLSRDLMTLGRDITNEIVINDVEVSRHHMRLSRSINGFMCEDLGSTNGTFINGKRVKSAVEIKNGDVIGLGETVTLLVETYTAAQATPQHQPPQPQSQSVEHFSKEVISSTIPMRAATTDDEKPQEQLSIFISYRKTNRNRVDEIAATLTGMGHNVTFDRDILQGQAWWDVIIEQIQRADLIVAMLSPAYLQSEPCHLEYMYATALNKRILPVQIEPINYRQLPVELQKIQMVDYFQQNKQTINNLKVALSVLPPALPMPVPMPPVPDAPIPEISKLKDEIINLTIDIGPDRQRLIAFRLYEMMRGNHADDAKIARELLGYMLRRPDTNYATGQMIEEWLNSGKSWWQKRLR